MRMSGREPLLPRPSNTPRAQIRRMNAGAVGGAGVSQAGRKNQVTKALLDYEDSETDSDENDDDEDEDFDSYDDENIVVTTFTTPATGRRPGSSPGSGSEANTATTTTTSIRLTRNNDESIIWVSSTDGDAEDLEDDEPPVSAPPSNNPKSLRLHLFPYEMF